MDVALASAASGGGLCLGLSFNEQLQFLSSPDASSVTPPHMMHMIQPMLTDTSCNDFIDIVPSFDDMDSITRSLEMPSMSSYEAACSSIYSDTFTSPGNFTTDVKSEFDMQSEGSFDVQPSSAVPYLASLPTSYQQDVSQFYFQTSDNMSQHQQCGIESSPAASGYVGSNGSPAVLTPLSHMSSAASCSPLSVPSSDQNQVIQRAVTQAFCSPKPAKSDLPLPPKKPLTPYMRFSKGIWQKVKAEHPGLSVCEVGAMIGRMWRELSDVNKQLYNEDFAHDKARYDGELQKYLQINGLQASDLVKPRAKKKDAKDKSTAASNSRNHAVPQPAAAAPPPPPATPTMMTAEQMAAEMARTILASAGISRNASLDGPKDTGILPHFSQVWSNQDLLATTTTTVPSSVAPDQLFASPVYSLPAAQQGTQVSAMYTGYPGSQLPSADQLAEFAFANITSDQLKMLPQNDGNVSWLWQQYGIVTNAVDAEVDQKPQLAALSQIQQSSTHLPRSSNSSAADQKPFVVSNDADLEPGEVRVTATGTTIGPPSSDLPLTYPLPNVGSKDTSELTLLRCALVAKDKEAARLTQELELAYGLIQRLQQQNSMYQQLDWTLQIQQQQQQQQQQQYQGEQSLEKMMSATINC